MRVVRIPNRVLDRISGHEAPPRSFGKRLLVIGPAWVGDMVLAQSLFKLLKSREPSLILDVAAPAWTEPLLARMPEVDEAILLPIKHGELAVGSRVRIGRSLRARAYEQAIVLPNSLKSAIIPFVARAERRTGYLGEWRVGLLNDVRRLDKRQLPRTVDRFIALGLNPDEPVAGVPPPPSLKIDQAHAAALLQKFGHERPKGPVLGLCPGAEYGPAKRWPVQYYAALAVDRLAHGWEVWLFGSDKDAAISSAIQAATQNRCWDLGGKTTLGEVIDLMSLTTHVVSNDSGLMHVAAALGRKLVAIFGSSDPRHTPPMNTNTEVLYLSLSCSPCFKRECPLVHLNCLKNIFPTQVSKTLDGMDE